CRYHSPRAGPQCQISRMSAWLQVKNFIALMEELDHIFGALRMGVADEYLPKIVLFDQAHQLGDPVFVQLVEDIVQQENWGGARLIFDKVELGQFQGDQKGFLLALAPELLNGMSGYGELQIVLMGAHRGILQDAVPLQIGLQQPQKVTIPELAAIGEHDLFVPLGNDAVLLLENGDESLHESRSFCMDLRSQYVHLFIIDRKGVPIKDTVGRKVLQQGVSLGQYPVVIDQVLQIGLVGLGDHPIDEFPTGLTALHDQVPVRGRNDHQG